MRTLPHDDTCTGPPNGCNGSVTSQVKVLKEPSRPISPRLNDEGPFDTRVSKEAINAMEPLHVLRGSHRYLEPALILYLFVELAQFSSRIVTLDKKRTQVLHAIAITRQLSSLRHRVKKLSTIGELKLKELSLNAACRRIVHQSNGNRNSEEYEDADAYKDPRKTSLSFRHVGLLLHSPHS